MLLVVILVVMVGRARPATGSVMRAAWGTQQRRRHRTGRAIERSGCRHCRCHWCRRWCRRCATCSGLATAIAATEATPTTDTGSTVATRSTHQTLACAHDRACASVRANVSPPPPPARVLWGERERAQEEAGSTSAATSGSGAGSGVAHAPAVSPNCSQLALVTVPYVPAVRAVASWETVHVLKPEGVLLIVVRPADTAGGAAL